MSKLTNNDGVILCPECLLAKLVKLYPSDYDAIGIEHSKNHYLHLLIN